MIGYLLHRWTSKANERPIAAKQIACKFKIF